MLGCAGRAEDLALPGLEHTLEYLSALAGLRVGDPDARNDVANLGVEVRVIHGKGIGNVKRSVEAILQRLDFVEKFSPASQLYGGLGATIVRLKPQ